MSFLIASPEALAATATYLTGIGSAISAANAVAAAPTTEILAAGTDEVSTAISALFGAHAPEPFAGGRPNERGPLRADNFAGPLGLCLRFYRLGAFAR